MPAMPGAGKPSRKLGEPGISDSKPRSPELLPVEPSAAVPSLTSTSKAASPGAQQGRGTSPKLASLNGVVVGMPSPAPATAFPSVMETAPTDQNEHEMTADETADTKALMKRGHDDGGLTLSYLSAKKWMNVLVAEEEAEQKLRQELEALACGPLTPVVRFLTKCLRNGKFDLVCSSFIILNALCMFVELEITGWAVGHETGVSTYGPPRLPGASESLAVLHKLFTGIFTLELLVRGLLEGRKFWCDLWHYFDAFLVLTAWLEAIWGSASWSGGVDLTFLRLLRIIRLLRAARMIKVLRIFRELRVLGRVIISSTRSLLWSMVILGCIEVMSAIFLAQVLRGYIEDPDTKPQVREFLWRYFGTAGHSCLTMFEITFGGWSKVGRPLIEDVNALFVVFFVLYATIVTFAITRVVGAMFIKETLNVAKNDAETEIEEKLHQKNEFVKQIRKIFTEVDTSGDGVVDRDEFLQVIKMPHVKTWLSSLGIEISEAGHLFNLLDNGDGCLSCDEFIAGAMRLRGPSRAVDVVTIMYENQKIINVVRRLELQVAEVRDSLLGREATSPQVTLMLTPGQSEAEPSRPPAVEARSGNTCEVRL
eukprot:gnl/TRDRNA2_/TRDRNA2_192002_c0_seq1.p1 gnl/TRDRNA2_/TRDRNA2_192002_c0~~gnl/TRDRNA2_/TRDRNA2_192002_c0_seq1.p1  ORF type:complete len:688 (-),score=128.25 gnl/TRDRNA2_/TRDRNA2_192002_c0_seq1:159-1940(-)